MLNEKGKSIPQPTKEQTFGANIHRLLADDFYMAEGFMGEFAKQKIKKVLRNLRDEQFDGEEPIQPDEMTKIIGLIGEPFLQNKMKAMFIDKFKKDFNIEKALIDALAEVDRLENLRKFNDTNTTK
jgi:hypothetical protein